MDNKFSIRCTGCGERVEFKVEEAKDLEHHIGRLCDKAEADGRSAAEDEYEGHIDAEDVFGKRTLFDLAAAISHGNRDEAKLQLDALVRERGDAAQEQVELGWFSPKARRAA